MNTILKAGGGDPTGLLTGKPKNIGLIRHQNAYTRFYWFDSTGAFRYENGSSDVASYDTSNSTITFNQDTWIYRIADAAPFDSPGLQRTPLFAKKGEAIIVKEQINDSGTSMTILFAFAGD